MECASLLWDDRPIAGSSHHGQSNGGTLGPLARLTSVIFYFGGDFSIFKFWISNCDFNIGSLISEVKTWPIAGSSHHGQSSLGGTLCSHNFRLTSFEFSGFLHIWEFWIYNCDFMI